MINGKVPETCCDTAQLKAMDYNINLAANFLQRCPSCMSNLIKHFCEMTCATNQSKFIGVVDVKNNGSIDSKLLSNAFL